MNWFSDPLAQLADAEAEWELQRDYSAVQSLSEQVDDLIDSGVRASAKGAFGQGGYAGWLGPARRAFDGREAELQVTLRLAAFEIEALATELHSAIQRRDP